MNISKSVGINMKISLMLCIAIVVATSCSKPESPASDENTPTKLTPPTPPFPPPTPPPMNADMARRNRIVANRIVEFAKTTGAAFGWKSSIPVRGTSIGLPGRPFLIDFSRMLASKDRQTILLLMALQEVRETNGSVIGDFTWGFTFGDAFPVDGDTNQLASTNYVGYDTSVSYYASLAIPPDRVSDLIGTNGGRGAWFTIAAHIESVSAPKFKVYAVAPDADGPLAPDDEISLSVDLDTEILCFKGECINLIKL